MRILFAFRRQSPQDNRVQILVSGRSPTLLQYPRGDSAGDLRGEVRIQRFNFIVVCHA